MFVEANSYIRTWLYTIQYLNQSQYTIVLFRITDLLTYSGDIEKYAQAGHPRLVVLNQRPKDPDKVDCGVKRCSSRKTDNREKGNTPVPEK